MGDSYRDELSRHRKNHKGDRSNRGSANREVEDRKQSVNAFFSKKGAYSTTPAQLRLWRDDA